MKKLILILVLFFGFSFAAKGNNNAVGIWAGDFHGSWGFDLKHLSGNHNAWDIYLGNFRLGDDSAIGAGFGYYWLFTPIKSDASMGRFPLHVGPNIGFGWWSGDNYGGFDIGLNVAGGISWFTPTNPEMDVSLELVSPGIGTWTESHKVGNEWQRTWNPALGLKGSLGLRLLFHVYFF